MPQESLASNPFMMMLQPEVVLAAVEKSERLAQLHRRTCRPLDRPVPVLRAPTHAEDTAIDLDDESADSADSADAVECGDVESQ